MEKKLLFAAGALIVAAAVSITTLLKVSSKSADVWEAEVEALASCEITDKKGNVVFECVGDEGKCDASKLGYTLICSGIESAR